MDNIEIQNPNYVGKPHPMSVMFPFAPPVLFADDLPSVLMRRVIYVLSAVVAALCFLLVMIVFSLHDAVKEAAKPARLVTILQDMPSGTIAVVDADAPPAASRLGIVFVKKYIQNCFFYQDNKDLFEIHSNACFYMLPSDPDSVRKDYNRRMDRVSPDSPFVLYGPSGSTAATDIIVTLTKVSTGSKVPGSADVSFLFTEKGRSSSGETIDRAVRKSATVSYTFDGPPADSVEFAANPFGIHVRALDYKE